MTICIIPARGGSKRLPRKNLLDLCGKPLIAWSIEAGIKSKYLDAIVLSSDDSEILKIGEGYKIQTIKIKYTVIYCHINNLLFLLPFLNYLP